MEYKWRDLLQVPATVGRSLPVRGAYFLVCAYIFLWVPDLDHLLLSILHHRSIITHSVLPGLLFLLLGWQFGAAPVAGALIGLSVHLSADLLSPMVGFAQIWLPAPYKLGLGPWSYLWLAGNALVGFALAKRIAKTAFGPRVALPVIAATSAVTAVSYGAFNEETILAALVTLGILAVALLPGALICRRKERGDNGRDR